MDVLSDDEVIVISSAALLCLMAMKKKRRRQRLGWLRRRWWVRPINLRRLELGGEYENQFLEMRNDDDNIKFFKYTRMKYEQFDTVLELLKPYLQRRSKRALPPEMQFVITLRYFITGTHFGDLAIQFRIGISTVHLVIRRTCNAIIEAMMSSQLPYPTEEDYKKIIDNFWSKRQMPNCCGCIDGKHISIQAPPSSGSLYYNYKGYFSIVLMAICDTNYRITAVDVGQYGSVSDGGVFSDCDLGKRILEDEANLPVGNITLPNSKHAIPAFFVADQAFPLSKRIMRPYPGKKLTEAEKIFNYRLSRARGLIENTFGILTARWKIFRAPINIIDVEVIDKIVLSIVCLHNFLQSDNIKVTEEERYYCPSTLIDQENETGEVTLGTWRKKTHNGLQPLPSEPPKKASRDTYQQRSVLKEFFSSDNSCPWQMEYIKRGTHSN